MRLSKSVDIIIPVYNAYDELVKCVESILKWTDLKENRVILVNDCSTDERVRVFLDKLDEKNFIIIHNEVNKGFSANINLGIAQSEVNDVLLLNSDTVVTKEWIEKIKKCAYSDSTIATVTPLSNNATLCSVPDFCAENSLPAGYTVDSYAEMVDRISLRKYPRIPVAHGFCMFIKREVIEKIGDFDAKTFGRGYGEENDFCHRAEQVGYYHVMCDDTFILHTGTSSFQSEEKKKYIEAHEKIIKERYPVQARNTEIYCRNNPNHWVSDNIKLHTDFLGDKKNILYLIQSDFREGASDNIGGTQLHVKDLVKGLRKEFNLFVAAKDGSYLNLTAYFGNGERFFRYYIGDKNGLFRDKKLGELYGNILDYFHIQTVHIHHTLGLSFELYYQAYEREIPIIVTLHDYYYICPTHTLLDLKNEYCMHKTHVDDCKECLNKRCGISKQVPYLEVWRQECSRVLNMAQLIIVPSYAAKDIIKDVYPFLENKMKVIAHGIDGLRKVHIVHDPGKFHVAFVGASSNAKGSVLASELVKNSSDDIVWHLFGMYGYNELSSLDKKNFIKTGQYTREELPELFEKYQIDLVCILSICLETFCYTLSEAVECGIPVLTTDMGALKERMEQLDCGWMVPYQSSFKDVLELIQVIKGKGEIYQEKLNRVRKIKLRSVEEMCGDYKKIYESLPSRSFNAPEDYSWILKAYLLGNGNPEADETINNDVLLQLSHVEGELNEIQNSMAYRALKILVGLNIPFKRQIKQLMYYIYKKIK